MLIKPMNSSYLSINVLHTTESIDLFGKIKVIHPATFYGTNFLRESATFSLGLILIYFPSILLQIVVHLLRDKKNVELQTCRQPNLIPGLNLSFSSWLICLAALAKSTKRITIEIYVFQLEIQVGLFFVREQQEKRKNIK